MVVRELITRLGFSADEAKVKRYEATYKSLRRVAAGTAAAFAAIGTAAALAVRGTFQDASAIQRLRGATGVLAADLQRIMFLATQSSVGLEEMGAGLRFFARTRGIAPTLDVLKQLSREMLKLDAADRPAFLTKMFGRGGAALGLMLEQGPEAIERMAAAYDKLNIALSDEQVDAVDRAEKAWNRLGAVWRGLRNQVVAQFAPAIEGLADRLEALTERIRNGEDWKRFTGFLRENRRWLLLVRDAVGLLLAAMIAARVWAFVAGIWAAVRAVSALVALAGVVTAFTATWAAFVAVLASPLVVIAMIALAFALLLNDIRAWQRGADSVIGAALGNWEDFEIAIFDMVDRIKGWWGAMIDYLSQRLEEFINFAKSTPGKVIRSLRILPGMAPLAAILDLAAAAAAPAAQSGLNPDGTPTLLARPPAGSNTRIDVRPQINVTVPPGTPEQQAQDFRRIVEESIGTYVLAPLQEAFPENEHGG